MSDKCTKKIKLSIIVPVYNVEAYLVECVNSVLEQKFKNLEIVLVNDGSTDQSPVICNELEQKNKNISVIHKKNGGLSDARNAGLRIARGEYVLFLDSDDYISENSLENIFEYLEKLSYCAEVVFLDAVKFYENGVKIPLDDGFECKDWSSWTKEEVIDYLSKLPKFPGSACTKLIQRDLMMDRELFFEKGMLSEDIDWTVRLLKEANTFAYCKTPYYNYRQNRKGSITNTVNIKNVESVMAIIEKWSDKDLSKDRFQVQINAFMAYEYMVVLANFGGLSSSDRRKILKRIQNRSWILSYGRNKKTELTKRMYHFTGALLTSKLLHFYLHARKQ